MARRARRQSATRLREATRERLAKDFATTHRTRRERDWRKPLVVHGEGAWPLWIDRGAAIGAAGSFFVLHAPAYIVFSLLWGPPAIRKMARGPLLELSPAGVRLLRTRPRRMIRWSRVLTFVDSPSGFFFEEQRDDGTTKRHACPGISATHRFRAASIFHAQTAANVFA
jgi:hypothetical protein